jgi:hypothetical protein
MFIKENFEQLIKANWSKFIDKNAFIRYVLEKARDSDYRTLTTNDVPQKQLKVSITKVSIIGHGILELWAEFSVPINSGMAIGTHVLHLHIDKNCEMHLIETHGTIFIT